MKIPWYVRPILLRPDRILATMQKARERGVTDLPNLWQLSLAVLRMWHRMAFRAETIGTCKAGVRRATWKARVFAYRPLRLPFLVAEGAVTPLDLTGLASPPNRIIRHLLGAHHDELQFLFDLELLQLHGQLPALREAVAEVVAQDTRRTRHLRDLVVFEGYHEQLLAAVERIACGQPLADQKSRRDPDLSFWACMRWCAQQPPDPLQTWQAYRKGRFAFDSPIEGSP